jgi:hypothetical protein
VYLSFLSRKRSTAGAALHTIDYYVVDLVQKFSDGKVHIGHGIEATLGTYGFHMPVLPHIHLCPQCFPSNKRHITYIP